MINLKSEVEISTLDEKLDHLYNEATRRITEIQKVAKEMMNDIFR
jgi:uncharacterized membrane protein